MRLTDTARSGGFAATSKLRLKQKNSVKLQQRARSNRRSKGINSRVK